MIKNCINQGYNKIFFSKRFSSPLCNYHSSEIHHSISHFSWRKQSSRETSEFTTWNQEVALSSWLTIASSCDPFIAFLARWKNRWSRRIESNRISRKDLDLRFIKRSFTEWKSFTRWNLNRYIFCFDVMVPRMYISVIYFNILNIL